jgi:transposase-like protein
VEQETRSHNDSPFDISKVQEKLQRVKTLEDLTGPGGAMQELMKQARPLDDIYPVLFMDAIHYKIRQDGKVISKAAYTCMGITLEGTVDVLGLWLAETEGSHFWLSVMSELKARGVQDILIACVDGLKGFPEAIGSTTGSSFENSRRFDSPDPCPQSKNSQ